MAKGIIQPKKLGLVDLKGAEALTAQSLLNPVVALDVGRGGDPATRSLSKNRWEVDTSFPGG